MSSRLQKLTADPAVGYVLRAAAWFLVLLGAMRLPAVQRGLLIPFARLQGQVAEAIRGEELRVLIDTSCTGSDAVAVCLGAILAYPASWKSRLLAAAGGFAAITAVNTVRIGHLSSLVDKPERLDLFHLRIWPALIVLVAAAYAFWWMARVSATDATATAGSSQAGHRLPALPFLAAATALVGLYYLFYEGLLGNPALASVAHAAAATAGRLMTLIGSSARVEGGLLVASGKGWVVTPECVTTPLIPLFVAAVLTARIATPVRFALLAATPIVFFLLGIARLMVLALPAILVGSQGVAIHAFYQLLLAVGLVVWLATRGERRRHAALVAVATGAVAGAAIGWLDLRAVRPILDRLTAGLHLGHGHVDEQGALLLLPGFAIGLVAAIWSARRRPGGWRGLALAAGLLAVAAGAVVAAAGELAAHSFSPPVVVLRLMTLALPVITAWALGWIRASPATPTSSVRPAPSTAA